tara:strand:- start:122 stop:757 length:636 start_codon:yes stop_codon:yes gene_type:complete
MKPIEEHYVLNTYNKIAHHFDKTRHSVWPKVQEFINSLHTNSLVADIGCGNGKNMCRDDIRFEGIDFCPKFVEICKSNGKNAIIGNCIDIPFEDSRFDASISIAVIHHLYKEEDRKQAIDELIRITKSGGKIMIYVWAFIPSKHKEQDSMIPWKLQDKYRDTNHNNKQNIINRYYHLFIKDELLNLVDISKASIDNYYNDYNNWIIELTVL